jgi:hypothetical protein
MSYLKAHAATSAADYSAASIGWASVSFYNHSAVAMAKQDFAGRDRDEHPTCLMTAGLLPIGITAVRYAGWF